MSGVEREGDEETGSELISKMSLVTELVDIGNASKIQRFLL